MSLIIRKPQFELWALRVLAILFVLVVCFRVPIGTALLEGFHEGEYLSSRFYFGGIDISPIMIHGVMDVLPSMWAIDLFGLDRAASGTRVFNALFGVASCLIFIFLFSECSSNRLSRGLLIVGGMVIITISYMRREEIFKMQQGGPAIRDFFLLLVLALFFAASKFGPPARNFLAGIAGAVAGLFVFWSYNRGVAGVAAVACYAMILTICDRSIRNSRWPLAGLLLGLTVKWELNMEESAIHIRSIIYWQQHQGIWRMIETHWRVVGLTLVCVAAICVAVVAAIYLLRGAIRQGARDRDPAVLAALVGTASLVLVSSLNRLDMDHITMALPYATLAGAFGLSAVARSRFPSSPIVAPPQRRLVVLIIIIACLLVSFQAWKSRDGIAPNLRLLSTGLPLDRRLVDADVLKVADILRESGGSCTYALDNRGLFNHLSGLPPCSAFLVPVYAAPDVEKALIDDIAKRNPNVIVFWSNYWSNSLNGIDQTQRTPLLFDWVKRNYEPLTQVGDIELVRRKPGPDWK